MTPKEKAIEIYEKYYYSISDIPEYNLDREMSDRMYEEWDKVDEEDPSCDKQYNLIIIDNLMRYLKKSHCQSNQK